VQAVDFRAGQNFGDAQGYICARISISKRLAKHLEGKPMPRSSLLVMVYCLATCVGAFSQEFATIVGTLAQ